MKSTMPVLIFPRAGEVEIQNLATPLCGEGDILVKSLYTLVSSGTELRAWGGTRFPSHPGYALIGEVVGVGSKVAGYRGGDLVSGRTCKRFIPDTSFTCGGHAGMHALPTSGEDRAVLLPPGAVPLDYVITEIASISQRGAEAANPSPGEVAVVVGQGLIGALSAAWLCAAGCHVIVTDFEQSRLDRALKGWAHAAVNGREADAEARLQALLDGGADIVVESSGSTPGFHLACRLVGSKPRGYPYVEGAPYRGEAVSLFHGRWSRLVMQATYVENATINPHSFFPGEGVVFLTPGDRSLDGRQKSVRALQSGAIRSSAFLDRVVDYRQAAEVYRSLRDEKDRIFSAVFDWTKA